MEQNTQTSRGEQVGIDPDTFAYEGGGGLRQCISGFGRNLKHDLREYLHELTEREGTAALDAADKRADRFDFCVDELVRWCRHFNEKSQRLESSHAAMKTACEAAFDDSPDTDFSLDQLARDIDLGMALPGMAVVLRAHAARIRSALAGDQP